MNASLQRHKSRSTIVLNHKFMCILYLSAMLISLFSSTELHAASWKLEKNEKGIKVYSRAVTGSKIHEVKAVITIKTSINRLLAVFQDIDNFPRWHHKTTKASMLKSISQIERYSFQNFVMPFPLTNRNLIIHSKLSKSKRGFVMTSIAAPKYCKRSRKHTCRKIRHSKNIMVPVAHAKQQIYPMSRGRIKLIWTQYIDPATSAPSSLVNQALLKLPFNTLLKLRQQVKLKKYGSTKFDLNKL